MPFTRRQTLNLGVAATATFINGWQSVSAQSAALNTRAIPATGEQIPVIGIGARNYRVGERWAPDTQLFRETIEVFHQLGGQLVDSSPNYGDSESIIGDIIAGLGIRSDLFLATKVDRRDRAQGITRMEASLQRLHTDHVDLIQVHNLIGWEEQLPLLREWKQAGRIKYLGITTSSNRQYGEMEKIIKQEALDFIQVDYAIDERTTAERILPLAAERGIAVLVNMPFGRGRFFKRVTGQVLPDWAAEIDCKSWAQFALKYVVSEPAVTAAIPGTTKPHHAIDNLGAARGELPDANLRKRMENFIDALPS